MILESIWYFLPAYLANMAPPLVKRWNFLDKPVSERIFGKNKTYKGIVTAAVTGTVVFYIQRMVDVKALSLFDYGTMSLALGLLLGSGAILGDLIESFFKRRLGIGPGRPFIPFDQLDFVIGGLLLGSIVYIPPLEVIVVLLILSPLLHMATNRVGYWLKITRKW